MIAILIEFKKASAHLRIPGDVNVAVGGQRESGGENQTKKPDGKPGG